ncbi:MAG: GTPase Era [Gammaproteobacteria bacterium 28-57-27]|nr:MAG: GTPase Era [Gammaproteobacteria bacterium 28-57-27]
MTFRCGHVGIVGRPNVGKSTLLNTLIGQKISITAPKPQTTRHSLIGVKTLPDAQILYVDTPGLHKDTGRAMSRVLNRAAQGILEGVDVLVFVIEGMRWTEEDAAVLDRIEHANVPVILAVNKVDLTADKEELLPFLQSVAEFYPFAEIIPISARKGSNLARLEAVVAERLPEGEALYDEDTMTTSSSRFMAAEFIREQITRLSHEEVPYGVTVEIENYTIDGKMIRIDALIWVEREGQKGILIGKDGEMLKEIGRRARINIENLQGMKVFLRLWVKVKGGWSDDERALRALGYGDPV